jgi:hypothetical protein
MTDSELLTVIAIGSVAVIGVFIAGFIFFGRFLKSEKARGERFREIHGKGNDEG